MKKTASSYLIGLCLISLFAFSASYAQEQNGKVIDTTAILKELREKEKNLNIREADLNAKEAMINAMEEDFLSRDNDIKKIRD